MSGGRFQKQRERQILQVAEIVESSHPCAQHCTYVLYFVHGLPRCKVGRQAEVGDACRHSSEQSRWRTTIQSCPSVRKYGSEVSGLTHYDTYIDVTDAHEVRCCRWGSCTEVPEGSPSAVKCVYSGDGSTITTIFVTITTNRNSIAMPQD